MKRFLFAVAVAALFACDASAQQPVIGTPIAPGTPVITTAGPVIGYAPTQTTQRRGLFGRLRNRNTSTMSYSSPAMVAPAAIPGTIAPQPIPMPGTITPMPMPGIRPAGAVIPATGNLPPGQYTTTDGTIIQIGGIQPMMTQPMMTQPMTTTTSRTGLFGRLRNR
jgi:hypothetical protein